MKAEESRVLLILRTELLDRARAMAGQATITLKLPVSLQVVLRALIEEGLKHRRDPRLLTNIESQARAIRRNRAHRARPGATGPGVGRANGGASRADR